MKEKSNKKVYFMLGIAAVILFFIGLYLGKFIFRQEESKYVESCRKFCEFIPDTEFSHVDSNNHCYCLQKGKKLYDSLLNKTIIYDVTVDVGIISNAEVKNYIVQ